MSLLDSVTEEAVDDSAKAGVEASLRDRSGADGSIRILLFKQISTFHSDGSNSHANKVKKFHASTAASPSTYGIRFAAP